MDGFSLVTFCATGLAKLSLNMHSEPLSSTAISKIDYLIIRTLIYLYRCSSRLATLPCFVLRTAAAADAALS